MHPLLEQEGLNLQLTLEVPLQNDKGMFFLSYPFNSTVTITPSTVDPPMDVSNAFIYVTLAFVGFMMLFFVYSKLMKMLKLNKSRGNTERKGSAEDWIHVSHIKKAK